MDKILDISILITCFNKELYLKECIDSVLRQTKHPREIIVVHDGCEDPQSHTKVTSIFLPQNMGVSKARHEAFRYSSGKLILFLDGDDMLSPDCIEKMVLAISQGADIAYPEIYFWAGEDSSLSQVPEKITPTLIKKNKKLGIPVTCLMKREVYEKVGGFKNFPVMEDLDFWLRAMCNDYTFKRTTTLLWYRQLRGNRNEIGIANLKNVINDIVNQFNITDNSIALA